MSVTLSELVDSARIWSATILLALLVCMLGIVAAARGDAMVLKIGSVAAVVLLLVRNEGVGAIITDVLYGIALLIASMILMVRGINGHEREAG